MPAPKTLLFIHIGKSAGSSFVVWTTRRYFCRNSFGAYVDDLGDHTSSGDGVYCAEDVAQALIAKESSRGSPYHFIPGHMQFGLHRYIDRPCQYCTLVRDPVDRVISAFNYAAGNGWLANGQGFSDFLDDDWLGNSNAAIRQLVDDASLLFKGPVARRSDVRDLTRGDFEAALENIKERFLFALPVSSIDQAFDMLSREYGGPTGSGPPTNQSKHRIQRSDLGKGMENRILEVNEWDRMLFETVSRT